MKRAQVPYHELIYHGLTEADMDTVFNTGNLFIGTPEATLREIVQALEETYCRSLGPEIMHITNFSEKQWLQQRLESVRSRPKYSDEQRTKLLERLTSARSEEHTSELQ